MTLPRCGRAACDQVVKRRGKRYCSHRCWAQVMNASWTPERRRQRAQKAGLAAAANFNRLPPARSASSRFL